MNYRTVILLFAIAFALSVCVDYVVQAEEQSSVYIDYNQTSGPTSIIKRPPLNYTPYINQGDTVYMNDTVDVSGVVPPYPYLAYWDGYDMYDSNASYIIDMPYQKKGYYKFWIDPAIFATRLGRWYKYDGTFEKSGYNLAFIVSPAYYSNRTLTFPNGTVVNLSIGKEGEYKETKPVTPPVPIRHITDYLIARGDSFNLTLENKTANLWLFGRTDQLMDYASVNSSIDVSHEILSHFEAGDYTLYVQTIRNGTNTFTVKYDQSDKSVKWFDPKLFQVHSQSMEGYSAQVMLEKFQTIIPKSYDDFEKYHFIMQEPSLEITSVEEKGVPNETVDYAGVTHYNTNSSFIRVLGYTNVAPGSLLTFILDESNRDPKTIKYRTVPVIAQGTFGGDMRYFEAIIPINKYNIAPGTHTVTGYTPLSESGTKVDFIVYEALAEHYIPQKTIRYISGQYGPEEFVPTQTPVVVTVTVVQQVPGPERTIVVPVTPSNEQLQRERWNADVALVVLAVEVLGVVAVLCGIGYYVYTVIRRRRQGMMP